jgi:hypothetical protein
LAVSAATVYSPVLLDGGAQEVPASGNTALYAFAILFWLEEDLAIRLLRFSYLSRIMRLFVMLLYLCSKIQVQAKREFVFFEALDFWVLISVL